MASGSRRVAHLSSLRSASFGLGLAFCGCGGGSQASAPDASQIVCGPGTGLSGSECLPVVVPSDGGQPESASSADASPPIACGPGTWLSGNQCLPSGPDASPPADASTQADAGAPVSCGAGTHDQGGVCVPDGDAGGLYEVRAPTSVQADGHTDVPILALGPVDEAGAGPAVILGVLPDRGGLLASQLTLGPLGTTTYYRPCNSALDPTCTGNIQVTMALAGAPSVIVATSNPIALVPPTGVFSDAACLGGGNVLFYDGDANDYIHPGMETISLGTWQATVGTYDVSIDVLPSGQAATEWVLDFSSTHLNLPLATQVYQNAERAPYASPGHPGIEIHGDGRGCDTITGSFQIEELESSGSTLTSFTATFEQHCEGGSAALRGCVHYGQ
jgi:hypothetical protein